MTATTSWTLSASSFSETDRVCPMGRSLKRTLMFATTLAVLASTAEGQSRARPNTRQGFWIGFGLGGGSVGANCSTSCATDRTSGPSGYVRLGGTVSPGVLLGGEANGWSHSESGVNESVGFASFIVMWYPNPIGAFYLKFGVGGMGYSADDGLNTVTATAPGGSFGLGYEFRTGRNFSVVPFLNSMATSSVSLRFNGVALPTSEKITLNLVQLGVGVTWH